MSQQLFNPRSKLVRFVASSLLALQGAIATTSITEFIATTPNTPLLQTAQAQSDNASAEDVYRQVANAVVYIGTERGSGSGVIVNANGLIVTNAHVLQGARRISVELHDGRKFPAEVVSAGNSKCLDLALLQIKGTNLPTLKLAATATVQKGQRVFAIGYPRGMKPSSITQGIVSNVYPEAGMIQTDAALIPGNSGGALLNGRGELLAINTRKGVDENTGMNFAIAADKVQSIMQASQQGISPIIGRYLIPASMTAQQPLAQNLTLAGTTVNGRLQRGSNLMCEDDSYANLYTFDGKAYDPIMLEMTSPDVGAYLMLLGPNGELVAKSLPKGRNETARLIDELPTTGTYTVIANGAKAAPSGSYRLQASTPLLVKRDRLDRNTESCMQDGSPCRSYAFTGKAGQKLAIALHQFEFAPYLVVMDAQGQVVAKGKAQRQDVITLPPLPQDGSYRLIVSTDNPSDRGQFFLSVHVTQPAAKPNQVSQNR